MQPIPLYCINYNNHERRQRMSSRFESIGIHYNFIDGINPLDSTVAPTQEMIETAKSLDRWKAHLYGCTLSHFMAIETFLKSGKDIGIICEDDIYIRKDFLEELPVIEANFRRQQLDVLMLGYLSVHDKPAQIIHRKQLKSAAFTYHNFDNDPDIWGCQMYMLSKEHAKALVENYGISNDYRFRALVDTSLEQWVSDCLITKTGNRAMISPMMAVEEGKGTWIPNQPIHTASFNLNYNAAIHI
jgi:GR25 family glycosyltransferase involved in LPS biosynthesis